jgi:hypothetical protein
VQCEICRADRLQVIFSIPVQRGTVSPSLSDSRRISLLPTVPAEPPGCHGSRHSETGRQDERKAKEYSLCAVPNLIVGRPRRFASPDAVENDEQQADDGRPDKGCSDYRQSWPRYRISNERSVSYYSHRPSSQRPSRYPGTHIGLGSDDNQLRQCKRGQGGEECLDEESSHVSNRR